MLLRLKVRLVSSLRNERPLKQQIEQPAGCQHERETPNEIKEKTHFSLRPKWALGIQNLSDGVVH
jgi:hypothetical protein